MDAALTPYDWVVHSGHADPAYWRGSYNSEAGLNAILNRRGGMLPLMNDTCARANFSKQTVPVIGSLGVFGTIRDGHNQRALIFDGDVWLTRTHEGFAIAVSRTPPLCIWGFL